jgi:hypothetical protein
MLFNIDACPPVLIAVTICPHGSLQWAASFSHDSRATVWSRLQGKDLRKSALVHMAGGCGAADKGVSVARREPIDMSSPLLGSKTLGESATIDVDWAQGTSDVIGTGEGQREQTWV